MAKKVKAIRCGQCGVDTELPTICATCMSPLELTKNADGSVTLACPHGEDEEHEEDSETEEPKPDYTARDLVPGFAAAVRHFRQQAGLTMAELARHADTTQATVSKIEAEKRAPSLRLACMLAYGLGEKLHTILDRAVKEAHA